MAPYNDHDVRLFSATAKLQLISRQHFRGVDIHEVATNTATRFQWPESDRRMLYQHAARYQMTCRQNTQLGVDELVQKLGISTRSEFYKSAVIKRAQAALLYMVDDKLRKEILVVSRVRDPFTGAARTVSRWPRYTLNWLKSSWNGDLQSPDGRRGRAMELRDDPPGIRAQTPARQRDRRGNNYSAPSSTASELSGGSRPIYVDSDPDSDSSVSTVVPEPSTPTPVRRQRPHRFPRSNHPTPEPAHRKVPLPRRSPHHSEHDPTAALSQQAAQRFASYDQKLDGVIDVLHKFIGHQQKETRARIDDDLRRRVASLSPPSEAPSRSPSLLSRRRRSSPPPSPYPPLSPPRPGMGNRNQYRPTGDVHYPTLPTRLSPPVTPFCPGSGPSPKAPDSWPSSQKLALESMQYSVAEVRHRFEAAVAKLSGDAVAEHWHSCGAQQAAVKRERSAKESLEALKDERVGVSAALPMSMVWDWLLKPHV
ncbi:hypothetical protein G7046_g5340 [Stylonectria norvegica]|nr:hypothetical protein G7046_g5340 [Stylonectria norvegica]